MAYDLCGTVDPCGLADRCARMAIVCVTLNSYPSDVCHWKTILLGQSAVQWIHAVFLIFVELWMISVGHCVCVFCSQKSLQEQTLFPELLKLDYIRH